LSESSDEGILTPDYLLTIGELVKRLSCGIVGLPNVGKSTLFNAITRCAAAASNYPFCTIDPNVGVVQVPDARLPKIAELSKSEKCVPAAIEFVDIAGLVRGASKGEGLGNQFLANIRETDAILYVVRCFEESDVIHVEGRVDPVADIDVIGLELILSDLQMVENSMGRLEKRAKLDPEARELVALLGRVKEHLDASQPARTLRFTEDERMLLRPYPLLSAKPAIYVANVGEEDLPEMENRHVEAVRQRAALEGCPVIPICAKLEAEIAQLDDAEQLDFLQSLGLEQSGLHRLIKASYEMLGLITYITAGPQETRAWTIHRGTLAPQAAGEIHSDIEKGFIRAEVVSYDDLLLHGGRAGAREAGRVRAEGKEYVVQDGDVILFLHN
jgi:ribosome-binding ATPase